MTPARRVIRQVAAGRPAADRKPGMVEALYLGRIMANRVKEAAISEGMEARHVACLFVCARPDSLTPIPYPFFPTDQDRRDLAMGQQFLTLGAEPIGVVFYAKDFEISGIRLQGRPFDRTERSESILAAVIAGEKKDFERMEAEFQRTGKRPL